MLLAKYLNVQLQTKYVTNLLSVVFSIHHNMVLLEVGLYLYQFARVT